MTPREAGIQAFYADESTTNTLQGLNAAFDAYEAAASGELWALCYLHDWDPPQEGQEHRWEPGKNVFPEVHAFYASWQDAEAVRSDMVNMSKYWVVRARPENEARLRVALSKAKEA